MNQPNGVEFRPWRALYGTALLIAAGYFYGVGGFLLVFLMSIDVKYDS